MRPDPILVEHAYDGKIEFNYQMFGGNGSASDDMQLMINNPEMYCLK